MNDQEPLARLTSANPFPDDSVEPSTASRDALFEEITMNPTKPSPSRAFIKDNNARGASWWRKPALALPSLIAIIGIFVAGALIAGTAAAPSALAMAQDAAANSASFNSGQAEVVLELLEMSPSEGVAGEVVFTYAFEGDNTSTKGDMTGLVGVPGADLGDELYFEQRHVDGTDYLATGSTPTSNGWTIQPDGMTDDDDVFSGIASGSLPAALLAVIEAAEDFISTSDDGDTSTLSGSVTTAALDEIGVDNLPVGLSMLVFNAGNLPATLDIEVLVADDQLQSVAVIANGDTETGPMHARVTTTFSQMGEVQNIVAPASAAPMEVLGAPAPDLQDVDLTALVDVEQRGICNPTQFESSRMLTEQELPETATRASIDAASQALFEDQYDCLIDAGEADAAEALRLLHETLGGDR